MIKAQSPQGALQAPGHQTGDSRVGLNHQHEAVALRRKRFSPSPNEAGAGFPSRCSSPRARTRAPALRRNAVAGADSQAPDLQTGAAQNPALKSVGCVSIFAASHFVGAGLVPVLRKGTHTGCPYAPLA